MEYDYKVANGECATTVTLTGSEREVVFDRQYNVFNVKSDGDVVVALSPGKSEGDDGVMMSRENDPAFYPHMKKLDRVYLTGTGEAVVFASNIATPVFKKRLKGGDTSIAKDYIVEGLAVKWMLDGNPEKTDALTNPSYVIDDALGRTVGKVNHNSPSFLVAKDGWGGLDNSGVTLQCLAKCLSFPNETSFLAVGYNVDRRDTACGIALDNNGRLKIAYVNGSLNTTFVPNLNRWYQLTVVYDNEAKNVALVVNGEFVERFSWEFDPLYLKRGAVIGAWVWSQQYPVPSQTNRGNFLIANCCIYERPLLNSEIAANYAVDAKRYNL